jgi:transposase
MRAKPWEVPDALWERIEPLLPKTSRRFRYPGRKALDDRRVLQGILFVLHTGIGWEHLPQELGFGCGMTAWRRLRAWQQAGVWAKLHELLLAELHAADQLEMGAPGCRLQPSAGKKGGAKTGPSPVDRGRRGSKHHLLVDGGGIPLAWMLTGGYRNDVTQLLELLDRVPPVRGRVGRPRRRPRTLIADRGYDHDKYRRLVWKRGVKPISPAGKPTTAPASVGTAGSSNAPSPGCTTAAASSAPTAATTSTKPSSPSRAASSAGDG